MGMTPSVAILFARADSVYKTMPECDVYDEARDARTFAGGMPIVAHPPCKRWSSLNNLVLARYPDQAERFAHGNDGGLFALTLSHVREFGGVLEHPAFSRAWRTFDLPRPGPNVWQRGVCGGWSIELDQAGFGHIARKRTWLYAFGAIPPLPPTPAVDTGRRVRVYRKRNPDGSWSRMDDGRTREITHAAAEHSPPAFARWLVDLAARCVVNAEVAA